MYCFVKTQIHYFKKMNRNEVDKYLNKLSEKIAFFRKEKVVVVEPALKFNLNIRIRETEEQIQVIKQFLKDNSAITFDTSTLEELNSLLENKEFNYDNTSDFISRIDMFINNQKNELQVSNFKGNLVKINGDGNSVYQNYFVEKPKKLNAETVIKAFEHASSSLKSENNKFHNLPNSHIERTETEKLLNFVLEKPTAKDKKVAFLIGNAGMGKTVITRDLYYSLVGKNIPCLALKADRISVSGIETLKKELELKYDFKDMFEALSNYDRVVLIIDQIDALSQTLSSDRKPIETYTRLIESLQLISNIKIVVSCRGYDLTYDTQLNKYQDRQQYIQIQVEKLEKEQVTQILSTLNIQPSHLKDNFIEFLSTPLHLDVFCRVYKPNSNLINSTITLQKLYDELWKDKIDKKLLTHSLEKEGVKRILEEISTKMYDKQTLTLKSKKYENNIENLNFLITENLLVEVGNKNIQFFHQTFFDYVFARFFVESEKSLNDDLENNIQGLFVRSRVKQVINYLKYYDEDLYDEEVRKILSNKKIRFHIKLIIIELISFYDDILIEEEKVFNDIIAQTPTLYDKFLSNVVNIKWIEFLFENHFELLSKNQNAEFLLARLTKSNVEKAIYILDRYYKKPNYNLIDRIVYNIQNFSNPCVIPFLERYVSDLRKSKDLYPNLIKRVSKYDKKWAFDELYNFFTQKVEDKEYIKYGDSNLINSLVEIDIELSYTFCKKIISLINDKIISYRDTSKGKRIINSYNLYRYYPNKDSQKGEGLLFDSILNYLESQIKTDLAFVKVEVQYLIETKMYSNIVVALEIMLINNKLFISEIYEILIAEDFLTEGEYINKSYLGWQIRSLLKNTFSLFTRQQQSNVLRVIEVKEYDDNKPIIINDNDGNMKVVNFIGFYKKFLLSSIPREELNNYPQVKKELQELERLTGKFIEKKPPQSSVFSRSGYPSLPQKAYERMSFKQWKQSFMKYKINERIPFDEKVTLAGNAEQFYNAIKENPQKFISFIKSIINDNQIHLEYKIRAINALIEVDFEVGIIGELFKIIVSNNYSDNTYFITNIYEYFFRKEFSNDFLFETLLSYAKTDHNTKKDKISSTDLNENIKGIGIRLLLRYGNNEFYSKRVFDFIREIALQNTPFIRMAIVRDIAYLNSFNKEESLDIFISLTKNLDYELLERSIFSLQYMANVEFEKLIPFFEKAIEFIDKEESDEKHDKKENTRKNILSILLSAWLNDYNGAEKLFFKALPKAQQNDIHKLTTICLECIGQREMYKNKSEFLLKQIMDNNDNVDKFWFKDLKPIQFNYNYDLLEYFTLSPACKGRNSSFYEYLSSCIIDEDSAIKCLQLLSNASKQELIHNYEATYIRAKSVEVIIKCYNTIRNHSKNEELINFALDSFDEELKRTNNQSEISKLLDSI